MLGNLVKGTVLIFLATALTPSGSMAVVRPRIVTITNSADALTLDLHVLDFLDSIRFLADNTQRAYRIDLEKLGDFIGSDLGVERSRVFYHDVSRSSIEAFRDSELHLGSKPATVQRRLDTVKAFSRYVKEKYNTSDRAAGVRGVVLPEAVFKGLDDEQHDRFLNRLEIENPRIRFVGHFFLQTGFREMSARAATFGMLRPDWSWIDGVPAKGRRLHSLYLSKDFRRELTRYIDAERGRWPMTGDWPLVVSDHGATENDPKSYYLSQKSFWRSAHDPMVTVGVPPTLAHPHTLRHTFAHRLLKRLSLRVGAMEALRTVSRALGHRNIQTTMKYLGVSETTLEEAMEA